MTNNLHTKMNRPTQIAICTMALLLLWTIPTGCSDEDNAIGIGIASEETLYNAKYDTLYADVARSLRDSMLSTGGNDYNIVGNYTDGTFGSVSAEIYTQVALPSESSSINLEVIKVDSVEYPITIDSVVLTLTKKTLYPDANAGYRFLFEVAQLAEAVSSEDTMYRANSTIAVEPGHTLYCAVREVTASTKTIRMKLGDQAIQMVKYAGDNAGLVAHAKGLRIRIVGGHYDDGMLTTDFAATSTRLTAYYRYGSGATDTSHYDFSLSHPFMHYWHNYSAAGVEVGADSVEGTSRLYLEPLAGYRIKVGFDSTLAVFRTNHPKAVIHRAELLLPISTGDWGTKPDRIVATYKPTATGTESYINDYLLTGVDGYCDTANNVYRLNMPRHLQSLLRSGIDRGTYLNINARRSDAARIVLNGSRGNDRLKLAIVYTE